MKPCKECGERIATSAKTCPHCGVSDPAVTVKDQLIGAAVVGVLVLVGFAYFSGDDSGGAKNADADSNASSNPCESNWRKCDDTSDLVNNYDGINLAQAKCESAAERQARYGEPEFPWLSFSSYLPNEQAIETGTVTLIENEAKFQNEFGAMAKVKAQCAYNLKSETVADLTVRQP